MSAVADLETACLALPPGLRTKLVRAGFRSVRDLAGVGAIELAADLEILPDEALAVLRAAGVGDGGMGCLQGSVSAKDLLEKEKAAGKILTFCGELDSILGGGVHTGQITEFCGAPGVGKTQIGIQLSVDVQIPRVFHGLEGEAVFIDTEGSFVAERARDIAEAFVRHLRKLAAASNQPQRSAAVDNLTWETVLERIHYFRALDLTEQLAALEGLEGFVQQHPGVKLVVLDSLAFHLRQDLQDMAGRTRLLAQVAQELMRLAERYDLAVVLMNHVTTKITPTQTRIVPALGNSWAHAATNRVILYWKEQQRWACLYKSPCLPARAAEYLVTKDGVRGRRQHRKRVREPQ